jgi:hypothetical protein
MVKDVPSLYSCHIEYNYLGKHGDCVDLNTLTDTFYVYPKDCDFSVTKMALATEELYEWHKARFALKKFRAGFSAAKGGLQEAAAGAQG